MNTNINTSFTKLQLQFLELVVKARKLYFNVNKIVKKDKIKQDEKRKIFILAHKNIMDNEFVEVLLILIKRNSLIKMALFYLIKYYIREINKTINNELSCNDSENDDLF